MAKVWSEEEIEFLENQIGKMKIPTIAKRLNRTENAVLIKIKRLGLGNTKNQTGLLTIGELADILKVDRKTVEWWVIKHGLKAKKRTTRSQKSFTFIKPQHFWEWAKENMDKIDFAKIEPYTILPEPEWVQEARKHNPAYKKRSYQIWTTKEDKILLEMVKQGYPYKKIGEVLGRSVNSIQNRTERVYKYYESKKAGD